MAFPGRIHKESRKPFQHAAFLCLAPNGIAPVAQIWALDPGACYDDLPKESIATAYAILMEGGAIFLTSAEAETVAEIRTCLLVGLDAITGETAVMARA